MPLAQGAVQFCPNCYCYVCDIPANDCKLWQSHCQAHHGDFRWKAERAAVALAGGPEPYAAAKIATAPSVLARSLAVHSRAALPPPPPSQQGNLATDFSRYSNRPSPAEYSIQAILTRVVTVYPSEILPPASFTTPLKHYQKQSLAFMCDVERSSDAGIAGYIRSWYAGTWTSYRARGGWLSAEVGMGKTAMILALVASDGGQILPALSMNSSSRDLARKTRLKATLVVTSVSLLGQWEDECRKHAPGLRCYRFHNNSKSQFGKNIPKSDEYESGSALFDADIIVTAATKDFAFAKLDDFCFNRIVVDESHMLEKAGVSMKYTAFRNLNAERRWCVTATPFVSRPDDILRQCAFLGFQKSFLVDMLDRALPSKRQGGSKKHFYASIDLLKKVMIRHTKDQQIGGSSALALPESKTRLVLLKMSPMELSKYNNGIRSIHSRVEVLRSKSTGTKPCTLEMQIAPHVVLKGAVTKLQALVNDFKRVEAKTPNLKAVVFTQYRETYTMCVQALRRAGITTREFSGSTNASARDKAINLFQSAGSGPQAFVITVRAGVVGSLSPQPRVFI